MGRVITPEIERYLELESVILCLKDGDHPVNLAILNQTTLWLIVPDGQVSDGSYNARFRFSGMYYSVQLKHKESLGQNGYTLSEFEYLSESFPLDVQNKVQTLFELTVNVQKRKHERIELDGDNSRRLKIKQDTQYMTDTWLDCILKDISFSGCRFICFGKTPYLAAGLSSLVIRLNFITPEETFLLPGQLIRKTVLQHDNTYLSDCAVQFQPPLNMYFEKRMNEYFQ